MKKEKLQNHLGIFRAHKKISQQELADAVSVSRQTINAIETGRYEPSCMLALKIAEYFKKNVTEIFWIG